MPAPSPMTPRAQAWAFLLGLGLLLALLRPVSRMPEAPPEPPIPGLRLLAEDTPWFDRARLSDPASVVLPPPGTPSGGPRDAVPEAMPFPPVAPDLRSAAEGGLRLPFDRPNESATTAATLPELSQPLLTLGERVGRALPPPLPPRIRATATDSAAVFEKALEVEFHKILSSIDLSQKNPPVLHLAIDAFGLQGRPVLLEGTRNLAADQALLRWAERQAWASWLPPGAYRIEIIP